MRIIKIEAILLLAFFALGILIFIKFKYIIAFIAWTVLYNLLVIHDKFIQMLLEKRFKIETFCDFPQIFVSNLVLILWAKHAMTFRIVYITFNLTFDVILIALFTILMSAIQEICVIIFERFIARDTFKLIRVIFHRIALKLF
jgi:hypothetical protein